MISFPNAKINLGLSVINKRADGMHDIETCYVPIPMLDILEILPSKSFSITYYGLPIPGNLDDNLLVKAWDLLSEKREIAPVKVSLYKNIPIGSGLGGGSSNAAFFLKAVNSLLSLGLSNVELLNMGSEIGADCSFFINNKITFAEGIGNVFSPIENIVQGMFISIVFQDIPISSKGAYSKIEQFGNSDLIEVLGGKKSNWKSYLKNDFENILFQNFPEIENIKHALYELGATYTSLTGSGSAVYAISEKPIDLKKFKDKYRVWTGII